MELLHNRNVPYIMVNNSIFFCQSEIQDDHHLMTKFYDGTLLEKSLQIINLLITLKQLNHLKA
jgi:hypothetical protein